LWNRAFFRTIQVRDGAIVDFTYEEPFASLLGSHKDSMVDLTGHCSNSWHSLVAQLQGLIIE
jgi:hypothetical protein